jgi:hypothetical protein
LGGDVGHFWGLMGSLSFFSQGPIGGVCGEVKSLHFSPHGDTGGGGLHGFLGGVLGNGSNGGIFSFNSIFLSIGNFAISPFICTKIANPTLKWNIFINFPLWEVF